MATLDPRIILGGQAPQLTSPQQLYAQKAAMDQNAMQAELGQFQLDQARQGAADNQLLRQTYRQFGTDTGANVNSLYKAGLGKQAGEYAKSALDQRKGQAELSKAEIEGQLQKLEAGGRIMAGVSDQATWDRARQQTAEMFGPEAAARMPEQYDPALVKERMAQSMSVKDRLAQQLQQSQFGETQRHNQVSERNTAAGQAVQIRGQDMTDTRTRDLNRIKQDEVTLKREAKQDTADMTKAGQIASFDTMLGTLDRLGKHPGLSRSVGLVGALPTIPGSDSANFQAELNTFQSQAFVPMVAQLKGMGALSDAEGRKLTAAMGALDPKMGEAEFRASVKRITDDMNSARARVAGGTKTPAGGAGGATGSWSAAPSRKVTVDGQSLDAKQAPNGKYYVQRNGKYFEVEGE